MLETMIVSYADSVSELSQWIDLRFRDTLKYIAGHITGSVYDMKGIQGDINHLSVSDRWSLQCKARADYEKACEAWQEEQAKNYKGAISKWGEILGSGFLEYG